MKVLLAYRCHDEGAEHEPALTLPPGLPWLAASLREAGHRAVIANFSRLGWKDVESYLREDPPDVFGVSVFTANRRVSTRLLRLVRRLHPKALIGAGGPHASALAAPLLQRVRELDFVVVGEGERPLVAACAAVAEGGREALAGIPGVLTRAGIPNVLPRAWALDPEAAVRALPDPDTLPLPAGDVEVAGVVPPRDLRHVVVSRRRSTAGSVHDSARSPASVLREVRTLRDVHGLIDLSFVGTGVVADRSLLLALAQTLLTGKAGVRWEMEALLDELVAAGVRDGDALVAGLRRAHRAGCQRLRITLDAGEVSARPASELLDSMAAASRTLRSSGIGSRLTLRYGTRDQDAGRLSDLRRAVRALQPREAELEPRQLLPGTPSWTAVAAEEGLTDQFWFDDSRPVVLDAAPRQVEVAASVLDQTLRDVCRGAQPSAKDLQAEEAALGPTAWVHVDWGDYRASVDDLDEASRRYRLAAAAESWNPWPWVRLAALAARGPRPDREREATALREVLNRVPRHAESRRRLEELRGGEDRPPARGARRRAPPRHARH